MPQSFRCREFLVTWKLRTTWKLCIRRKENTFRACFLSAGRKVSTLIRGPDRKRRSSLDNSKKRRRRDAGYRKQHVDNQRPAGGSAETAVGVRPRCGS